jgi:hypothetical protein
MSRITFGLIASLLVFAATSVSANECADDKMKANPAPVTSAVKSDNLVEAPVLLSTPESQALNKPRRVKRIVMDVPVTSKTRAASTGDEKRFVHSTSDMAKSKTYGETKRRSVAMPNLYKAD